LRDSVVHSISGVGPIRLPARSSAIARESVYFAGSKIAGVVPWVPAAGTIGMGIDMMSYDGGVTVSLQVDAGLIPDPETIIADYEREVVTLRKLAARR
jgi:hypothetical protein